MSVTWHNINEVSKLESKLERLEEEVKYHSQLVTQLSSFHKWRLDKVSQSRNEFMEISLAFHQILNLLTHVNRLKLLDIKVGDPLSLAFQALQMEK